MKVDVKERKVVKILKSTDTSKIFFVTSILERKGKLYFGSLLSDSIGVVSLPQSELKMDEETVGNNA